MVAVASQASEAPPTTSHRPQPWVPQVAPDVVARFVVRVSVETDETQGRAAHGDMRIEVVKRAVKGALAGFPSAITDYAARLIIDALDSYDEHRSTLAFERGFEAGSSLDARQAYADGFRQGVAFGRAGQDAERHPSGPSTGPLPRR